MITYITQYIYFGVSSCYWDKFCAVFLFCTLPCDLLTFLDLNMKSQVASVMVSLCTKYELGTDKQTDKHAATDADAPHRARLHPAKYSHHDTTGQLLSGRTSFLAASYLLASSVRPGCVMPSPAVFWTDLCGSGHQNITFSIETQQQPIQPGSAHYEAKLTMSLTRGQSNLTKSASRGAHSPVRGHPRGSKVVPLNSWGRVSY